MLPPRMKRKSAGLRTSSQRPVDLGTRAAGRLPCCQLVDHTLAATILATLLSWPSCLGGGLLARFGAIPELRGVQYWSVSDKRWRVLITEAAALNGPDLKRHRSDFTPAEMMSGEALYFAQDDSRSQGEIICRMQVRESSPDRLILEVENVSPAKAFLMTPPFYQADSIIRASTATTP